MHIEVNNPKLIALLARHTEPDGDKIIKYVDGLTDEKFADLAAKKLGATVTPWIVYQTRRNSIGMLRRGNTSPEHLARIRAIYEAKKAAKKNGKAHPDMIVEEPLKAVVHPGQYDGVIAAIDLLRAEIVNLRAALESAGE